MFAKTCRTQNTQKKLRRTFVLLQRTYLQTNNKRKKITESAHKKNTKNFKGLFYNCNFPFKSNYKFKFELVLCVFFLSSSSFFLLYEFCQAGGVLYRIQVQAILFTRSRRRSTYVPKPVFVCCVHFFISDGERICLCVTSKKFREGERIGEVVVRYFFLSLSHLLVFTSESSRMLL